MPYRRRLTGAIVNPATVVGDADDRRYTAASKASRLIRCRLVDFRIIVIGDAAVAAEADKRVAIFVGLWAPMKWLPRSLDHSRPLASFH